LISGIHLINYLWRFNTVIAFAPDLRIGHLTFHTVDWRRT